MSNSYATTKIFQGSKNDWADFCKDVFLEIMSNGGPHAVNYLKPDHPQRADGTFELPVEYIKQVVPATPHLGANPNANAINAFNAQIKIIDIVKDHNKQLQATLKVVFAAISSRLSSTLNTPLGDNPTQEIYEYFRKLKSAYGPNTLDSTSNAAKENKLERELIMADNDIFFLVL